jgi:hypothetical protein
MSFQHDSSSALQTTMVIITIFSFVLAIPTFVIRSYHVLLPTHRPKSAPPSPCLSTADQGNFDVQSYHEKVEPVDPTTERLLEGVETIHDSRPLLAQQIRNENQHFVLVEGDRHSPDFGFGEYGIGELAIVLERRRFFEALANRGSSNSETGSSSSSTPRLRLRLPHRLKECDGTDPAH